jgi:hypothetical protein
MMSKYRKVKTPTELDQELKEIFGVSFEYSFDCKIQNNIFSNSCICKVPQRLSYSPMVIFFGVEKRKVKHVRVNPL